MYQVGRPERTVLAMQTATTVGDGSTSAGVVDTLDERSLLEVVLTSKPLKL